jgi:pyrroloquinoline-quinone synthase
VNSAPLLLDTLNSLHLLRHPFYQAWSQGKLSLDDLKAYARQYYHHVAAFPRYVSATHSGCSDLRARQVLLANLVDEEHGPDNHPELWLRFSEGLGDRRQAVMDELPLPQTSFLVDTFMRLSRSSYEEGLGALFAYEQQVPAVAASKVEGLKRFYGVEDPQALRFFDVHLKADVWHAEETKTLMEQLTDEQKLAATSAAEQAARALWGFLDGMVAARGISCGH